MKKAEKILRSWRNGAIKNVRKEEIMLVLKDHGFELRPDCGNHLLAEHPGLRDHPEFGLGTSMGRFKINCHAHGHAGEVHIFAVKDALRALDWMEGKEGEKK